MNQSGHLTYESDQRQSHPRGEVGIRGLGFYPPRSRAEPHRRRERHRAINTHARFLFIDFSIAGQICSGDGVADRPIQDRNVGVHQLAFHNCDLERVDGTAESERDPETRLN